MVPSASREASVKLTLSPLTTAAMAAVGGWFAGVVPAQAPAAQAASQFAQSLS